MPRNPLPAALASGLFFFIREAQIQCVAWVVEGLLIAMIPVWLLLLQSDDE